MPGVLLDTHALYWLVSDEGTLAEAALLAIALAQEERRLFVSPISAWELAIATLKPRISGRPNLGEVNLEDWFRSAVRALGAKVVLIHIRISADAANVVTQTGHRDPGDCLLMATARVRRIPVVTRDRITLSIAQGSPNFLAAIAC